MVPADLADLAAGRVATVSVPSVQAVPATAGVLGLPGLPATGLQAHGPAGGAVAHAPAAPGQAGPATALRRLGLLGVDARLAPLLLLLSPLLSLPARLLAFRLALATVSVSLPPPWMLLRLPLEVALTARVPAPGPLPWLAQPWLLLVFSALPSCFKMGIAREKNCFCALNRRLDLHSIASAFAKNKHWETED